MALTKAEKLGAQKRKLLAAIADIEKKEADEKAKANQQGALTLAAAIEKKAIGPVSKADATKFAKILIRIGFDKALETLETAHK